MKKFFASILAVVMVLALAVPAAAQGEPNWSGVNVSPVNPMEKLVPFGTEYPSDTYYPHSEGALHIKGTANTSALWLSKMVLGCDEYYLELENKSSSTLVFSICRQNSGDINLTLGSGDTYRNYFTADPDEIVCMKFNAPSNFEGDLYCACNR